MSSITRIAITGGPCAGKTTGISIIEQELSEKGYRVFVVPEAATLFINSGAAPWIIFSGFISGSSGKVPDCQ